MATAAELRDSLATLTTLVTNFVTATEADRKRAADAAATPRPLLLRLWLLI